MKSSIRSDIADHRLYKLYWGFILPDICRNLELPPTPYVKEWLHGVHKRELNYESISGRTQEVVSLFLFEVGVFWAERGIFVRTKEDQPIGIEWLGFDDIVEVRGQKKKVWDLL